jgi:hypothetical protein
MDVCENEWRSDEEGSCDAASAGETRESAGCAVRTSRNRVPECDHDFGSPSADAGSGW